MPLSGPGVGVTVGLSGENSKYAIFELSGDHLYKNVPLVSGRDKSF